MNTDSALIGLFKQINVTKSKGNSPEQTNPSLNASFGRGSRANYRILLSFLSSF